MPANCRLLRIGGTRSLGSGGRLFVSPDEFSSFDRFSARSVESEGALRSTPRAPGIHLRELYLLRGRLQKLPDLRSASLRLRELATLNRRKYHSDFWALQDVSFEVPRGRTFCIVGENGSGKSTLLQIVAGILEPTKGTIHVGGRVSALLELGSGFNPEFTGRENVYLNAAILGFNSSQIDRVYRNIEEFAEIGSFIDQPVKTYSSGMVVRLAFSVAIHTDPEILIVDEALAVGDIYFRQRCLRKVHELRDRGITILFVSHAAGDVKAIGDSAMWLDKGQVREIGSTDRVVSSYLAAMAEKDSTYLQHRQPPKRKPRGCRHCPGDHPHHSERRSQTWGRACPHPGHRSAGRIRQNASDSPSRISRNCPDLRGMSGARGTAQCRVHAPESSWHRFRGNQLYPGRA